MLGAYHELGHGLNGATAGVAAEHVNVLRVFAGPQHRRSPWTARRTARAVAACRPQVIHCLSGEAALCLLEARNRFAAPPLPFVVSLTGTDLGRLGCSVEGLNRIREVLREARRIIVDSETASASLLGSRFLEKIARGKVTVVRPQVPLDDVQPLGPRSAEEAARDPRLHVVFIGPFVERQGLAFLIEAVARMVQNAAQGSPGERGAALRLVGSGPMARPARALARHLGIAESVQVVQGVTALPALLAELRGADVFACPSITASGGDWEPGAPPALLLALAAAVPVVATRHGGIPESIEDGRTGFLAEEHDVGALVAALVRVRDDPALSRKVALAGREHVGREHSPQTAEEALESVYQSAASL